MTGPDVESAGTAVWARTTEAAPATGSGGVPAGRWRRERRWVGPTATVCCIVISLLPLVITIMAALTVNWNRGPLSGGLTTGWITGGWTDFYPRLVVSVEVAAQTLVIDFVVGLPMAWAFARSRLPGLAVIQWFAGLPLAIPGMALGLALVAAHPELQSSGQLLIAGHVLVTLPFLLAAVVPVLAEPELGALEQVAASLGAGPAIRALTIVLPHIRTALISAALMILTLSFGEFNLTYFVVSPASQTLPVGMYSAFIYGDISSAAAQTLLYCAAIIPAAVILQIIGRIAVKRSGS